MPRIETELAIVGAGPAGLSAAIESAKAGVQVLLIDENPRPGGQLFKQIHKFFGSKDHRAGVRGIDIGEQLLAEVEQSGAKAMLDAVAWGIFADHTLGVIQNHKSIYVKAQEVLLATGASENALAFPGWTLAGVMGAGAIQTLVNVHRVLPGRRILMVGSGNVGLIVTYQLLQAGAEVVAVLEGMPGIGGYGVHASKLRRNGVPILTSTTIKEARGTDRVEQAVTIALDRDWHEIPGTEREYDVDVICLALGLTPLSELAWLAGCKFDYIAQLGGHIPVHDANMETTVSGLYVAGDVSGIEEACTAMEEGRLAGIAAAVSLGHMSGQEAASRKEVVLKRLDELRCGPFGLPRNRAKERLQQQVTMSGKITLERDGFLPAEGLAGLPGVPSQARLEHGPVAVIECAQEIPCNPCEEVCHNAAIQVGESIINLPVLIEDRCDGCGLCIAGCPGQAIFVVNMTYSDEEAAVQLPYEFLPLPEKDEIVDGLDREGEKVCTARVVKVLNPKKFDRTAVITIAVPKECAMTVRNIAIRR
ncbi:MAG: FAD-dependent oxidoreductase [Anaerolineales bacterium]|nr:MAG: FAD-dependent oxidoreductase [Anaerolineales bacterium]